MAFNQTVWGNISISLLMWAIPILALLFFLSLLLLDRLPKPQRETLPALYAGKLRLIFLVLLVLTGSILLVLFSLSYPVVISLLAQLSPDRQVASLTEPLFKSLSLVIQISGGGLLLVSVFLLLRKDQSNRLIQSLLQFTINTGSNLVSDSRVFFKDMTLDLPSWSVRPGRMEIIVLVILTVCGFLLRVVYINKPFLHDEAYTYVGFASRTLRAVVTDYSLPNNHVLHTILVFFSTQLFGPAPWAVRLPAFVCGVLLIPAVHLLARRLYNPGAAVLAAALVSFFPDLVTRSTGARGYLLMTLITLLIYWLGAYVRQKPNRTAWLFIIVLSSLGFYTLPIMLYPFGGLLAWLAVSALLGEIGQGYSSRWSFIWELVKVGFSTILMTLLFYSTILIGSGPGAFFGNGFIKPLNPEDFLTLLPLRINDLWHDWQTGLPFDIWIALFGMALSLVLNKKLARQWTPWLAILFLWIGADLIIQRPDPNSRLWSFLLPLLLISIASGWNWLFEQVESLWNKVLPRFKNISLRRILLSFVILLGLTGSGYRSVAFYAGGGNNPGPVEKMVINLGQNLQPGDWVISVSAYEPPMWYYFRLHNISWSYLDEPPGKDANRYLVIVYGDEKETVETILEKRRITSSQVNPDQRTILQENDSIRVYALPGIP